MDFPEMIKSSLPKDAIAEMAEFRKADTGWMKQEPVKSTYDSFEIKDGQKRYTIEHNGVPFECLYLPRPGKKLYVALSGGGSITTRKYPSFLRWKYQNILDGSVLCIDDPMYYFHPEFKLVQWYYGTNDISYLHYVVDIVKKFMEKMSLTGKDVTFLGSSGGGYSSLYCSNMIDYSSAIAVNPQFVLKDWNSPIVYDQFKTYGIDLAKEDKFGRNFPRITNKTSHFVIILNSKSYQEYERQFEPFFERQGITPHYGIAQFDNIVTWIHGTDYESNVHSAIPHKNGFAFANFLLNKLIEGEDVSKYNGLGHLANEVIYEKYEALEKFDKVDKEKKVFLKFFSEHVGQLVREAVYRKIPRDTSSALREFLEYKYDVETVTIWSTSQVSCYIGEQRAIRYNAVLQDEKIFLRLVVDNAEDNFKNFENLKAYLEEIRGTQIANWRISDAGVMVMATVLYPDKMDKKIFDFVDLTINMLNKYLI